MAQPQILITLEPARCLISCKHEREIVGFSSRTADVGGIR
jgi:hypothetical protein